MLNRILRRDIEKKNDMAEWLFAQARQPDINAGHTGERDMRICFDSSNAYRLCGCVAMAQRWLCNGS